MGEKNPCSTPKSTQELLLEFQQTGQQGPFEEIARRYAGMVYNVALQVTRDAHDAEDATQATFLTLAVHAKTAGKIRYVGPWLRKVSQRLALDIRRSKKRRVNREQRHAATRTQFNGEGGGPVSRDDLAITDGLQLDETRAMLREELDKLPAKYRMPLILYYFGGLSPEEMSKELKCKTSTLGVRLHRGRKMLAENLSSRGMAMGVAVVGATLTAMVDSFVRDNLVHSAAAAAASVGTNGFVASSAVSAPILSLSRSVTAALRVARLKGIIVALCILLGSLGGVGQILGQLQLISPTTMQHLNPLRLIRPLFQRLFSLPRLMSEADVEPAANPPTAASSLASTTLQSTISDWSYGVGPAWQRTSEIALSSTRRVTGSTAHVESERLMAAEFDIPASSLPLAPINQNLPIVAPSLSAPTIGYASASDPTALAVSQSFASFASNSSATPSSSDRYVDTLIVDRAAAASSSGNVTADSSTFVFGGGSMRAHKIIVGDKTDGTFIQNGGNIHADELLAVANQVGSAGTYIINSGVLSAPTIVIGSAGSGTFIQNGGHVSAVTDAHDGQVVLGDKAGSIGIYLLNDGTLSSDGVIVGNAGYGAIRQLGGMSAITVAQLGQLSGGTGLWSLNQGVIQVASPTEMTAIGVKSTSIQPANTPAQSPMIVVGGDGSGTILLRSDNPGSSIQELPGAHGTALIVRPDKDGAGTLRGWGKVGLTGPLVQNGKVIADGYGQQRELDFSSLSVVTNNIENPTINGSNGWFASNGGSLKLPTIHVAGGGRYTWGDNNFDPVIDLVNSVRFRPHAALPVGDVNITLLDPLDPNVPLLPTGQNSLGLWQMDSTVDFSSVDLIVRYDDAMADVWQVPESDLALWVFDGTSWSPITDSTAKIDTTDHLLWGSASKVEYFAAALLPDNAAPLMVGTPIHVVPEPSTLLGALAAAALMRRRRR